LLELAEQIVWIVGESLELLAADGLRGAAGSGTPGRHSRVVGGDIDLRLHFGRREGDIEYSRMRCGERNG